MALFQHPILEKSFAVIDQEIGEHSFSPAEYAIVRRVIHSTADFEFKSLIRFSPDAIQSGIQALQQQTPIVTDVSMVRQGIQTLVSKTFDNPIVSAVDSVQTALPGKTRSETGMLRVLDDHPSA
ncbi:MAG TPA: precorrin-8X methylmutase, partial [Elainellaceae cyanobacterium]